MQSFYSTIARVLHPAILALALAAVGGAPPSQPDHRRANPDPRPIVVSITATVDRVIDGDTMVLSDSLATHVRLVGVDCPERGQPGPWATYAADRLRALTLGRPVTVIPEPGARDPYGRTLAHVVVLRDRRGPWTDVGEDLVGWGLAYAWTPAGRRSPSGWPQLQQAERWAQATGVGVWSDPGAVRPDVWRRRKAR